MPPSSTNTTGNRLVLTHFCGQQGAPHKFRGWPRSDTHPLQPGRHTSEIASCRRHGRSLRRTRGGTPTISRSSNLEPKAKGEKLNLPVSVKLVDETLAAPDILGASRLLAAAMSAYGLARVEDAAFLCYAAILRMNVDLARFVPKDRGSDSPAVYHRSLVRVMESGHHASDQHPARRSRSRAGTDSYPPTAQR